MTPPLTLPSSPRNTTQRDRGEPVPDPAACHHHEHHGQRSPQKHLLSQLQWPCWRQQTVSPCGPGCGDRWEPLCWWLQLYPAHLSLSKCDQYLGVTVNGHTGKLLFSRSPFALGFLWVKDGWIWGSQSRKCFAYLWNTVHIYDAVFQLLSLKQGQQIVPNPERSQVPFVFKRSVAASNTHQSVKTTLLPWFWKSCQASLGASP